MEQQAERGASPPTDWTPEVDELRRRSERALELGGADKVKRHHEHGRLTVRERIEAVLDPGSFSELGRLTGKPLYAGDELVDVQPANLVCGTGTVDGRPVVVSGDDFTIRGGSADGTVPQKANFALRLALEYRMPLIQLVDGSGGGGGLRVYETGAATTTPPLLADWKPAVDILAVVPVVSMVGGSVAGLGAVKACNSHYSVMVEGRSQVFTAGPPLVGFTGEQISKEELGGSATQTRNGVIDDAVPSEEEGFVRTRRFLGYLPSSVHELPPRGSSADPPDRREGSLLSAVPRNPRQVFDVRRIIDAVVDEGSFFEMTRMFGRALVTGLARLDGYPVAVIGSDPRFYGGGLNAAACQKLVRFVDFTNTFHLPLVGLYDIPGLVIGRQAEEEGTVRLGTRALAAMFQSTVPQCAVVLRRFYGLGSAAQVNTSRLSFVYAWPSANWGSMPFEGGIEAAYRAELEAADDVAAKRAEIEARFSYARSPFRAAEGFRVTDIIDPRDTRPRLTRFAAVAYRALRPGITTYTVRP
jgi:acetyl-CoA carboxylase carboxyltransferase component